jgi:NAD(P)-dependent dehydrogenase (short-subunit alcohol dehydrogenase family)
MSQDITALKSYRKVLITGAASGLGRALAERFSRDGAQVMAADRNEAALRDVAEQQNWRYFAADVSNADEVEALAEAGWREFGEIDLICLNAGVSGPHKPSWEKAVEEWSWVIGPNLWGIIHGIRSFLPRLLAQKTRADVLITASAAGLISMPFGADYLASKHAAVSLAESLAQELEAIQAPIKVGVLCPGFVRTNILRAMRDRFPEALNPVRAKQLASYEALLDQSPDAAEVVDIALRQWREGAFYLLTHPGLDDYIAERHEAIMERRLPASA